MHLIKVNNVNHALPEALMHLALSGVKESSRNGPVLVAPGPVVTEYTQPERRVLFDQRRDCNPYLHFFEALWMLDGRRDVAFPAQFAKNMLNYSDDGVNLHGAYGDRWRNAFGYDQLPVIINELRTNPETRRCVLAMWDASAEYSRFHGDEPRGMDDLHKAMSGGKDVPCNTHAYIDCRGGRLNLTVLCRSNDAVWGAYGANAVHFSMLQEYLAAMVGVPLGTYIQFSNNLHVYTDNDVVKRLHYDEGSGRFPITMPGNLRDPYSYGWHQVAPFPMMPDSEDHTDWHTDLRRFLSDPYGDTQYRCSFFHVVAAPLYASWYDRKTKKNDGLLALRMCEASDWKMATREWIGRRELKGAAHG